MANIYLKSGWRNILANKWFSIINIIGLAGGLAASIMLYVYIDNETGFDRFHNDGDRISRIITSFGNETESMLPRTFPGVAQHILNQSPLVEATVRIRPEEYQIKFNGETTKHQSFLMTDPAFADLFNFRAISGNLEQTLSDPSAVAISADLAITLFGQSDPLGQVMEVQKHIFDPEARRVSTIFVPATVGAVLENPPKNTHLQFAVLQSYLAIDPSFESTFSNDVFVYFKTIKPQKELNAEEISDLSKEYVIGIVGEEYRDNFNVSLQPLHNIHFGTRYGYDMGVKGNIGLIRMFSIIALFILVIAIINFINLMTAQSEKRATEAAIRKVSGASRREVIMHFVGESLILCTLGMFIALILAEILVPHFSQLLDRTLSLSSFLNVGHSIMLLLIVPAIAILAGAYPSLLFSGLNPSQILRGKGRGGSRNPSMRIALVIVQFGISVLLIISILVFNAQVRYMKNSELGFSAENVIVMGNLSSRIINGIDAIKAELLMNPSIKYVTTSQSYPGVSGSGMSLRKAEDPPASDISATEYRTGKDFELAYDLKLKHGRWFDYESKTDLGNFVINETASRMLGMENPVGQEVIMWQRKGTVIGVVEDFHFQSLKNKIEPLILTAYHPVFYTITVKMAAGKEADAMAHMQKTFAAFDPNYKMTERRLDTFFKSMYRQEDNINTILVSGSILAVIIAILGILGLSSYIMVARYKEIGIRKVLGATMMQIVKIMFRDITRWVLLANVIAWPLAWLFLSRWLQEFPYRISMSWYFLMIACLISLLIMGIAVSAQILMAAGRNPIHALKSE